MYTCTVKTHSSIFASLRRLTHYSSSLVLTRFLHCTRHSSHATLQEYIFCISASHHSEHLAVVGYKNGLIVVLQADDQGISVSHRLRGHDSDVHSLDWNPATVDCLQLGDLTEKVKESQGNLFISGSRDQTIRLWDALNGKVLSILNLPKRSSQKWKDRHDWQSKDRLWLALCWPKSLPNKFISSSHSGELLLWDISSFSGSEKFQFFSQGHSRIVFNICCNDAGTRAVSSSMDRQIIVWDMRTLQSVHSICTLGGFVYGLDISPLDPGTVAVGVGDNMIRVWHTTSPISIYDAMTLWQGIKAKVQVVSWHPSKEGVLAFGTDSGQVGVYNIVSKKPNVFASYHKTTVYSLSWGPPCPELKDKNSDVLHVYSCSGDGSVLQHKPNQPLQDSINVNKLIQSCNSSKHKVISCTDVSWNCNHTVLAVGNQDGTIEVFTAPSLRRLCTISVHKKSITYLAWHPGYGEDTSEDECRLPYRLASASNETAIHIHDLSSIIQTDDGKAITTITSSHRKLVGHSGRVTSLCWSPHHCDMIVSASYDGTAQVWNVETNQGVANYRGHIGRLLSVQWSFLDADVVYSGGEDGSVRSWSIKEQEFTHPPVASSRASKPKKKSKSKTKETAKPLQVENEEQTISEHTDATASENKTTASVVNEVENTNELSWRRPEPTMTADSSPFDAHEINEPIAIAECDTASISSLSTQESGPTVVVSKTKGESSKKKRKFKSMFPVSAIADNNTRANVQQDCIALAQFMADNLQEPSGCSAEAVTPGESSNVHLGLFADRTSAYKMFHAEGRHHSSANNLDYQLQLEVWKGNLGGAIEKAIKARQLSDWLVAMSGLAGRDVWLHTVESYAKQLKSEGSHQRAVLYYLACHKVYEAIDVFANQAMYREAIALAKVRLSPSDPVLHDLYCAWAKKLESEHYENAAKCYLAAGLASEAVRVLSLRGDQASLTTALKVAVVSGLHQLASSLSVRVMHIGMATGNWLAAQDCLMTCNDVEGHLMVLYTHEILVDVLVQQGVLPETEFKDQVGTKDLKTSNSSKIDEIIDKIQPTRCHDYPWSHNTMTQPRDWLIIRVLKVWERVGLIPLKTSCTQSLVDQMSSYLQSNLNDNLSLRQILIRISYEISLGLLQGIERHNYSCSLPWLRALQSCIKNNYFVLAQSLCVHLLPRGQQSLEDVSSIRRHLAHSDEKEQDYPKNGCKMEGHLEGAESMQVEDDCERDDPKCKRETFVELRTDGPEGSREREDELQQAACSAKLLSYFSAFYSLVDLYELWWQVSHLLENCDSEMYTNMSGFSREFSDTIVAFNVARKAANGLTRSVSANIKEDSNTSELQQDDDSTSASKHPLSACLQSDSYFDLLGKDTFRCASLKEQLLEIKKEIILLRSRRILDSVAAACLSKPKRAVKKKEQEKQVSLEDREGEESFNNSSGEVCPVAEKKQIQEDSERAVRGSLLKEPLDIRYKSNAWTLELLQDEEQRLLQELATYPLKDLPFPDPVESSIVIAHVCSFSKCAVHCGLDTVTCGLEHALWSWQRKALIELQKRLLENSSGC